jgi:hypothetical protein
VTRRRLERLEWQLPLVVAAIFVALLALALPDVLTAVHLNADAASAPVIAELLGERRDLPVRLGEYFWFEALYLLRALVWLPGHRQLGQVLPLVLYALSVGAIAWTIARAVGRRRALLVLAILACPAPAVLDALATLNFHGLAFVHTVVLSLALVMLLRRDRSTRGLVAGAALLALVTAPGVASDQIAIVGGLLPFLLTATVLGALRVLGRREVAAAWGAALGAAAGAAGLLALLDANDVVANDKPFATSTVPQLFERAQLFLECFGLFGHGQTGQVLDGRTAVLFAATLGSLGLLAVTVVALRRAVPRLGELPPLVALLVTFWGASGVALFAAFVSTSAVVDVSAVRYVLGVWPAVLVVFAVLVPGWAGRLGLAATVLVVAGLGVVQLQRGEYDDNPSRFPDGAVAGRLAQLVDAERLDHGYSGYWSAASLTFQTRFEARVYPVRGCAAGACPFDLHRMEAWYAPRPGVRSFYVVDTAAPEPRAPEPPAAWGAERMVAIGALRVFVYPYDVASRLGPAPN